MSLEKEIVIHEHLHQPNRFATIDELAGISTDPQENDWTKQILLESYYPQVKQGIFHRASYDVSAALSHEIERLGQMYPDVRNFAEETNEEFQKNMAENGIADSYFHIILPDQSDFNKRLLIRAGRFRYQKLTKTEENPNGINPLVMWPAETAMDNATAQIMAEEGITAFICAPHQLSLDDGSWAANQLTRVRLQNGKEIIAVPFDRGTSHPMGFEKDAKIYAPAYLKNFILPYYNEYAANETSHRRNIVAVDGETFGHYHKFAELFLEDLLNRRLPEHGISVVSVNKLVANATDFADGTLIDRTAWSCECGNLDRWNTGCGCNEGVSGKWKETFSQAHRSVDQQVTKLLLEELGMGFEWDEDMVISYLAQNMDGLFNNRGGRYSSDADSLLSAKVSSLAANNSCGTFYQSPGTSGYINMIFAVQSVAHLKDAGLVKEAESIFDDYLRSMELVQDPFTGVMGDVLIDDLLRKGNRQKETILSQEAAD